MKKQLTFNTEDLGIKYKVPYCDRSCRWWMGDVCDLFNQRLKRDPLGKWVMCEKCLSSATEK